MSSTNVRATLAVLAFTLATPGGIALADDFSDASAKKFFNDRGCNACHGLDEQRIGPSYRNVAARYAGDGPGQVDRLITKIRLGGGGAWGVVPMISNPNVAPDEAEKVVRWILSQRKPES